MNSANINARIPDEKLANRSWRFRHSAWLLAPILGFGWFSFVGFLYIAVRMKQKRWWLLALAYTVASTISMVLMEVSPDVGAMVTLVIWIVSIVHGVVVNRDYLRWRSLKGPQNAWYTHSTAPSAPATPSPAQQASNGVLGVHTDQYYGTPQSAAPRLAGSHPPVAPPPVVATPQQSTLFAANTGGQTPVTTVDMNRATQEQIGTLPGMTQELAAAVIAERTRRGGFTGFDDFANAVNLQPHQRVKVRDHITFSGPQIQSAPSANQTRGRILDI